MISFSASWCRAAVSIFLLYIFVTIRHSENKIKKQVWPLPYRVLVGFSFRCSYFLMSVEMYFFEYRHFFSMNYIYKYNL
jgi:hypothetical protein